jgi:predicted PhzF superfamily epimerase YddE/YHI9
MDVPVWQVDAFADGPSTGNPAAVLLLTEWPDDAVLRAVAAAKALPETAFVICADDPAGPHAIRWFSPTAEVALCGHATLAAGHVLLSRHPELAGVRFATRTSGMLEVIRAGERYAIALPLIDPQPAPLPMIVAALRCPPPVATLFDPRGYAIVVLADQASVAALLPDFLALAAVGDFSVIVTARGVATDIVARVFVPAFGVDEDPVTGSAYAAIALWWSNILNRMEFSARQLSARGGSLHCRIVNDRVWLEGGCTIVAAGREALPTVYK